MTLFCTVTRNDLYQLYRVSSTELDTTHVFCRLLLDLILTQAYVREILDDNSRIKYLLET